MRSPLLTDPDYCRRRADEIRKLAVGVEDGALRARLVALGDDYERMALRAQVRVAAGIVTAPGEDASGRTRK
jgi:hypothetical protein